MCKTSRWKDKVAEGSYLDHDEVLLDLSVVREAAHGVDGLVGDVVPGQNSAGRNE